MATKAKTEKPAVKKKAVRKFVVVNTPPSYWQPEEEGESVEGTLIRSSKRNGKFGEQTTFYIETETGELGLPSHTVLNNGLLRCKIGDYVKITVNEMPSDERNFIDYIIEKAV